MKIFLFILISLLPFSANSQTFGVHLGSFHTKDNHLYNNINPGVYYRDENNYVIGLYVNSYKRRSVYIGHVWEASLPFSPSLTLGGATGYKKSPIVPLVAASIKIGDFRPSIIAADRGFVIHLSVERKFK